MRIANLSALMMAGVMSLSGSLALAEGVAGRPVDKGMGFQRAVTEVARDIHWLDNFLLIIITAISVFVTLLILIVIVRFNKRANPKPATFTHNPELEVAWTAFPVLILVVIAIPSLRLLFLQLDVPEPDLTIKATGNQWYWSYEYPDEAIEFDAVMLQKDELAEYGYTTDDWLLATDTRVVVPVNAVVHVLVTGSDVLHAWTIPSLRLEGRRGARKDQRDLVPRRGDRCLLRPVLGALRTEPLVHADRRRGRQPAGLRRLGADPTGDERGRTDQAGRGRVRAG